MMDYWISYWDGNQSSVHKNKCNIVSSESIDDVEVVISKESHFVQEPYALPSAFNLNHNVNNKTNDSSYRPTLINIEDSMDEQTIVFYEETSTSHSRMIDVDDMSSLEEKEEMQNSLSDDATFKPTSIASILRDLNSNLNEAKTIIASNHIDHLYLEEDSDIDDSIVFEDESYDNEETELNDFLDSLNLTEQLEIAVEKVKDPSTRKILETISQRLQRKDSSIDFDVSDSIRSLIFAEMSKRSKDPSVDKDTDLFEPYKSFLPPMLSSSQDSSIMDIESDELCQDPSIRTRIDDNKAFDLDYIVSEHLRSKAREENDPTVRTILENISSRFGPRVEFNLEVLNQGDREAEIPILGEGEFDRPRATKKFFSDKIKKQKWWKALNRKRPQQGKRKMPKLSFVSASSYSMAGDTATTRTNRTGWSWGLNTKNWNPSSWRGQKGTKSKVSKSMKRLSKLFVTIKSTFTLSPRIVMNFRRQHQR